MFSTGCLNKVIDRQPRVCASGDTASATTVALVGDSDATMWAPAFQQVAAQRHWRLETLAKAACPPMNLPIINPTFGGSTPNAGSGRPSCSPVARRASEAGRGQHVARVFARLRCYLL
ncbi:putative acyltransferase 3 [Mycobacterium xenopi 3993]|nr:putative acyltransferase 3 [Mycobacterium xenopi 3993]